MPDLPPVEQRFIADVTEFIAAMDDIIAKCAEVAAEVDKVADSFASISEAALDMATIVDEAAGRAASSVSDISGAAARAAASIDASAATEAGSLGRVTSAANDVASALGDARTRAAELAGTLVADAGAMAAVRTATAGAGDQAARTYGYWRLSGTAIHWMISGSAELLAVLLPATVAAGAWAFAWVQGATNVYEHLRSLFTVTEAWGQAAGQTYGELLGLHGIWQQIQNEANPDVYQALGGALNIVKESFGGLADVGLKVGQIFDTFVARLVTDFSKAGSAAGTMNDLLAHMLPDLVEVGQFFGNLGAALASFAAQMPGLAEFLLGTLTHVTSLIKDLVEFAGQFRIAGWSVLTVAMAFEEFNRWGSLVVGLLGRMGFGISAVTGGFFSLERAGGVLMNLVSALPMALSAVVGGLGNMAIRFSSLDGPLAGAGVAMQQFAIDTKAAMAALTPLQAALIAAGAVLIAVFIDKLVRTQSAVQQLSDSMQKAAQSASDLNVLSVVSGNLSKLQQDSAAANNSLEQMSGIAGAVRDGLQLMSVTGLAPLSSGLEALAGKAQAAADSTGMVGNTIKVMAGTIPGGTSLLHQFFNAFGAAPAAAEKMTQIQEAESRQVSDAANVVVGANQIAKAYGLSIPQAMVLAQTAGVSLTKQIQNQNGTWNTLGNKIADTVSGFHAMGAVAGPLGNDLNAMAIQAGLAGTHMSELNQAWDAFMQDITGGTSGLGALEESMQNLGLKAATSSHNLASATTFTESSMSAFAQSLTTYTGKGAQAWQNFDQVVGSTAPQLIDWLRTAGAMGVLSGKQVEQGGLDMVAGLIPLAAKAPAAQAELLALAHNAGWTGTTFKQLKDDTGKTGDAVGNLGKIVNDATTQMGNMSQVAQNLGDVMNDQVTSAISAAALAATGFNKDANNLTQALAHNGTYGGHTAAYWAQQAADAFGRAGKVADQAAGAMGRETRQALQLAAALKKASGNWFANMYVRTDYTTMGSPPGTGTPGGGGRLTAGGGYISGPGTSTSDSIPARLSDGEYVVRSAAVAHYGRQVFDALNAKQLAGGGMASSSPSAAAPLMPAAGGGGPVNVATHVTASVSIGGQQIESVLRSSVLTYTRRNPGNNWSLNRR